MQTGSITCAGFADAMVKRNALTCLGIAVALRPAAQMRAGSQRYAVGATRLLGSSLASQRRNIPGTGQVLTDVMADLQGLERVWRELFGGSWAPPLAKW